MTASGTITFNQYQITFGIDGQNNYITLYDSEADECWTMDYEDATMIMPTVTMLMYSETMREEFCNA